MYFTGSKKSVWSLRSLSKLQSSPARLGRNRRWMTVGAEAGCWPAAGIMTVLLINMASPAHERTKAMIRSKYQIIVRTLPYRQRRRGPAS